MKNIFGFKLNAIALAIMLSSTSVYAANTIIVSKNGSVLSNKPSNSPALNIDGTKIAFVSHSGNLVGDTKLQSNIYLKDTTSNTIVRVSVDNSGIAGERASYGPTINGDGNKVVFYSSSENLVSSDGNGKPDVFLRDLKNNSTQLISVTKSGVQGDAGSIEGVISADGNVVAFSSRATTLTGLSTNAKSQVYVKDLFTGDLEVVSINNSGDAGDQDSFSPSISRDGRYISFASFANNLSSIFNFNQFDIYVYDRQTKKTELITASANLHSGTPSISGDGRYVAFMTLADNLVSGDTVNTIDIVVYDRVTKIFKRVQAPGEAPKGHSFSPKISSDGRFVAFYSSATNLVSGDTNDRDDMFVFDLALNRVERVSVSATGAQSTNNVDQFIALSGNGQAAAFGSPDGIFVSGDTNGVADIFVRQRDPAQSVTPVAKIAVIPTQECTNGSAYIKLDGSISTDITNKATYTWTGP
ncbi:MAG: hypothetical protein OEX07_13990, partial [Gammaproteobacteria bacterium]|nr:hypothetical protein [Gammaproteobacteria bacterium]